VSWRSENTPAPGTGGGWTGRWIPLAGVLALLAVVVFGGPAAEELLATPNEPPIQLASGIRIQPLPGWRASRTAAPGGVLLTRGSGNLVVLPAAAAGVPGDTPTELSDRYLEETLLPRAEGFLSTDPEPVTVRQGVSGVRVEYEGEFIGDRASPVTGEAITVVTPDGIGVVFDAWGTPETFEYVQDDVRTMIGTAVLP
jgi:hypothetical protein